MINLSGSALDLNLVDMTESTFKMKISQANLIMKT